MNLTRRSIIFMMLMFLLFANQIFAAKCGDVNSDNKVNIVDALLIAQAYVGTSTLSKADADVNGDNNVNIVDALLIAQFYVGQISSLSGCGPVITETPTETPTEEPISQPGGGSIKPDGYAAYAGTTGGGNAKPIKVSSAGAFKSAVKGNNAAVIIVQGFLKVGTTKIGSNKTIIGANASSGIGGGDIQVQGSNYIFKNLIIGPSGNDAMEISGATKVYVTNCTFHDSSDELCSIVRGSDYVTVSWSKFYFDNSRSHSFAHLIGSGDSSTGDRGKLHVTLHHNWYSKGIKGRIPRVRFGHVHIYNNYINSPGNNYCIGTGKEANIRLENTHFDSVSRAWKSMGSGAKIGWKNIKFESTSQPTYITNSYPAFSLPYTYDMDPVDEVKSIVTSGAGNVF